MKSNLVLTPLLSHKLSREQQPGLERRDFRHRWIATKQRKQIAPVEYIEMKQSQNLLKIAIELARKPEVSEQQVDAQGDPYLSHHGIFRGADEGLDVVRGGVRLPARAASRDSSVFKAAG